MFEHACVYILIPKSKKIKDWSQSEITCDVSLSVSMFLNKLFEVCAKRWSSHTYLPTSWDEKASTVLSRSCDSVHWSFSPTSTVFPVPASLTCTFIMASHKFVFYHSLAGTITMASRLCSIKYHSLTCTVMMTSHSYSAALGITGVTQKAAQCDNDTKFCSFQ